MRYLRVWKKQSCHWSIVYGRNRLRLVTRPRGPLTSVASTSSQDPIFRHRADVENGSGYAEKHLLNGETILGTRNIADVPGVQMSYFPRL